MEHPSHLVKRTDCIAGAIGSKMNIDRGGIQSFMPKQSFDGEQVGAIFIKVGAKRMSERVAGKAFFPSKTAFMLMDVSGNLLPVNTSVILTPGLNSGINFTQKTGVRISKRLSMGLEMPLNILEDTPIRSPFPTAASVPLRKIRSPFPQEVKSQETPAGSSLCPMKNSCDAI